LGLEQAGDLAKDLSCGLFLPGGWYQCQRRSSEVSLEHQLDYNCILADQMVPMGRILGIVG